MHHCMMRAMGKRKEEKESWPEMDMLASSFLAARHHPYINWFQMSKLPGGYSVEAHFLISSFIENCNSSSDYSPSVISVTAVSFPLFGKKVKLGFMKNMIGVKKWHK